MNCQETKQSRCLAGVSRCDITPPVGIYHRMWGAATHDRSTGVHRHLTATAMYLSDLNASGKSSQVIIAVDHCLLWPQEMNRLLDVVSAETEIPRETLIVFFSHTHGAGLMGLERKDLPGGHLIEPYLKELATNIAGVVAEARNRQTPATIVYGHGRCGLATNRDYLDEKSGHYVCGFNPTGIADDTVLVARVVRNDTREPISTIVNYACHPTTLAWDNTLISPDYIGAMRETIEMATGVPCIFIQGASGDVGPREGFVGDPAVADRNGRQLGHAALAALESLPPAGQEFVYTGPVVSGATIGTWQYRPQPQLCSDRQATWKSDTRTVSLQYRSDLPSLAELEQEETKWKREEQAALAVSDSDRSRHARAMLERANRRFSRVEFLPNGETYPYPIIAWRIGDAVWVALDGEHYNILQRTLRSQFPGVPLVIGTIANGSKVWYLPDAESYGLGLYQEEVSVLERGSLETVIDAAAEAIRHLLLDT
jgi:hypothetical protein